MNQKCKAETWYRAVFVLWIVHLLMIALLLLLQILFGRRGDGLSVSELLDLSWLCCLRLLILANSGEGGEI